MVKREEIEREAKRRGINLSEPGALNYIRIYLKDYSIRGEREPIDASGYTQE